MVYTIEPLFCQPHYQDQLLLNTGLSLVLVDYILPYIYPKAELRFMTQSSSALEVVEFEGTDQHKYKWIGGINWIVRADDDLDLIKYFTRDPLDNQCWFRKVFINMWSEPKIIHSFLMGIRFYCQIPQTTMLYVKTLRHRDHSKEELQSHVKAILNLFFCGLHPPQAACYLGGCTGQRYTVPHCHSWNAYSIFYNVWQAGLSLYVKSVKLPAVIRIEVACLGMMLSFDTKFIAFMTTFLSQDPSPLPSHFYPPIVAYLKARYIPHKIQSILCELERLSKP